VEHDSSVEPLPREAVNLDAAGTELAHLRLERVADALRGDAKRHFAGDGIL
jgi:hypothetical protein